MSHPTIPNIQEQIRQTTAAHGALLKTQVRTFFLALGFIFLGLPQFPPGSQPFLLIGTFILVNIVGRAFKQRLRKKHPTIFANENWKP
jgi:hypothetical protein